jgi:cell division protein FtsW
MRLALPISDNKSTATRDIRELDAMLLSVVMLCCIGLVMAVSILGPRSGGPLPAMQAQGWKLLVACVAFLLAGALSLPRLRRHAWQLFWGAVLLCLVAALVGHWAKGATRWIRFGDFGFQPVEPARLLLIVVAAAALARAGQERPGFRDGFVPVLGAALALALALLLQPDFGNALIAIALAAVMALVAGVRVRWFLLLGLPLLVGVVWLMADKGYVQSRLQGFANPQAGSQVAQSMLAIGSGGLTGRGIGNGWMKMGYVPEPNNDFVFAIIGEELGLLGSVLVLALFTVFGWAGIRLVLRMQDPFLRYLVFGLTFAICLQATINLLVVTGMAPAKGIDLPFISSGGTNLVFALAAVGLIGNAARTDARGG